MTMQRSAVFSLVFVSITALGANACSGSKSSGNDGSSSGSSGKGTVLSGGTSGTSGGSGGTGAGGGTTTGGTSGSGATSGTGGSTSGSGGTSGSSGKGGSSGSSGTTTAGALGSSCTSDANCASGLTCITTDSQMLGGGGPPGGLCTLACTADTQCTALAAGAYCVTFDSAETQKFCLEGCLTGQDGAPKCHERSDFLCSLLGVVDGTTACKSNSDCGDRQICDPDTNTCADTVTGCLPGCRGDFDCTSAQYCDYLSGMCLPGKATGAAFGTSCDPSATTDPCNGFCSAVDDAGKIGSCVGFCSLTSDATGCGWNGTGTADAACVFGTALSPANDFALGDVGLCGALCDCNDDCKVETERCVDDSKGVIQQIWGRAGYCRPLITGETDANSIACK